MKHIVIGYILLILLPTIYLIQMSKLKKPFENKLGVIVFSVMGFLQVFIGVSKLSAEGINISENLSYLVLGLAFLILVVGSITTIKQKSQKHF